MIRDRRGVVSTMRASIAGERSSGPLGWRVGAIVLVGVLVVLGILLGHVALARGWLDWGPILPGVVRAFAAATALGIGLVNLANYQGQRRHAPLVVGVAFVGFGVLLVVRTVLHLLGAVNGDVEAYATSGRMGWSQHMFMPLALLFGIAIVSPRSPWPNARSAHAAFAGVAVALLIVAVAGPLHPAFPGSVTQGVLVARPDASWVVSAYLVLLALLWRRPDLSGTIEGRWLAFALYVGLLNQTLVAPFWHTAAGAASTLDAAVTLLLVAIVGAGTVLGMADLSRSQAEAISRLRAGAAERERVEGALARQAARLKLANEELAQYAYLASHDLQEPLRMVTNYLQLIERRYTDVLDDDGREFMRFAVDGAVRMKRLTNDLLLYSRVSSQRLEPTPTDAGEAFRAACKNLEVAIDEVGAEVTSETLPVVSVDSVQLIQLFQNIVGNSLKFRRPGGRPRVHASAEREGDVWRFSVRDNGIGIDERYHDRVFAVFQRLHAGDAFPGSGIGLALCRKIVERHGGRIWFESVVGEGTTFSWTLPVDAPYDTAAEPLGEDSELERTVSTLIDRAREVV